MDKDFEEYLKKARKKFCLVFKDYNAKEVDDFLIDYTQEVKKAINYNFNCKDLCGEKDKVFICKNQSCMLRKCKKCG